MKALCLVYVVFRVTACVQSHDNDVLPLPFSLACVLPLCPYIYMKTVC